MESRELQRRDAVLLQALRDSLAGGEHRLYRTGKLDGLFASKSGPVGEAAALALREELLEHVRTEVRGRFEHPWVIITPKGVDYLYEHDSPRAILGEMRKMLRSARNGIPTWQDEMLQSLERLGTAITDSMGKYLDRLDALMQRVDHALKRIEIAPEVDGSLARIVPWAMDALTYLDRRKQGGRTDDCPLSELFAAVRSRTEDLSLRDFHDGLRRLAETHALHLTPHSGTTAVPQPEYALLIGADLMTAARR